MANRYWVGGTASWDGTAGTKWALTSGGAGGQSVPTSADDVFFSNLSTGTVTIATGNTGAKSINCTGFTGTLTGTAAITVSGSVTLVAGMTYSHTGTVTFAGTGTLTTAGKAFSGVTVSGSGITLTLGDALNLSTRTLNITQGTFTTNNYNVTTVAISSSNSNVRTINLGSSTITLSGVGPTISFATATNLTFNAGTSQITFSGSSGNLLNGGGQDFYNVSVTGTTFTSFSLSSTQPSTFNNLSIAGQTAAGVVPISISADQTINGTLTLSAGTNATMRTFVRSNTLGTTRTLTCAAVASLTDIDFRDITIAGAAAPVSGTRLGDCKGNSGITFPAAKTVYWNLNAGGNWSSTAWALAFGGPPAVVNFPLAQDTAIIYNTTSSLVFGGTVTINANYNIGTLDMSLRTANTMTLATGSIAPAIYGNWINGTGTTLTGTSTLTFAGRGSQTITSAGKTFTQGFSIQSPSGSVTLQDALTASNGTISPTFDIRLGTFDLNGYNLTQSGNPPTGLSLTANPGNAALVMGAGNISIGSSGSPAFNNSLGCSVTGSGTISFTHPTGTKEFRGGGVQTYPTINQGGTGTLTVTGSNKFANITNTAIGSVLFIAGTTNEFAAFNLNGTSTAARLTLGSTTAAQATLRAPNWNVGTGSLDSGNNTGLSFTAGTVDFLNISYINGVSTGSGVVDVYIIEATTASDTAAANAVFVGVLSETATVADVTNSFNAYLAAIEESTTAFDLAAATIEFSSAIAEITTASDSTAALKTMTGEVSETTQAADTINGGLLYLSSISEVTTASEIADAFRAFNAAVLEATSASEIAAAQAAFLAVVPEQVSGSDILTTFATLGGSVTELASAADAARRAKIKFVDLENYVATEATTTAMTVEATVTGNTASGTVESGQITATVLP